MVFEDKKEMIKLLKESFKDVSFPKKGWVEFKKEVEKDCFEPTNFVPFEEPFAHDDLIVIRNLLCYLNSPEITQYLIPSLLIDLIEVYDSDHFLELEDEECVIWFLDVLLVHLKTPVKLKIKDILVENNPLPSDWFDKQIIQNKYNFSLITKDQSFAIIKALELLERRNYDFLLDDGISEIIEYWRKRSER